ncbi:vegetative incompatibility het-e-1 [Fusarium albosuccineum]|uniref:Vegetative incompatibility het-e-1 n=1 Tax=Fusarium albosuccineum TaxID=1237068 RepID=A0A8H4KQ18_9HYPO|nr:vegetative incompatibility het-e-1 [Fusarium albosuccineum]
MSSSASSIQSTLRARIDLKILDTLSHDSPKSAFISIWLQLKDDYEAMRQDLNQYLSHQLGQNRIRATLQSRTKPLESIKKSIDRRESSRIDLGGRRYESPQEIFDDVHDLVGFRIVVDYLSGLKDSYSMIDKTFRKERKPHVFSSDRQVGQFWKPRFGAYEAQNYQVRLDPKYNTEFPIYHGVLENKGEDNSQGVHGLSQLPDAVRKAASLDQTEEYMDDLVDITPNVQSVSQAHQQQSLDKSSSSQGDASSSDRVSRETLLYSLFDPSESIHPDEEFWAKIRSKLGLSGARKEPPIVLPTVFDACFDSEELRRSPQCDEDTRTEVRAMIREWVDDTNAETLLWLHAPAGTGKSTLARTLVNDFEHEKRLAAGYFFKRGDDVRNDTARVFTTIATQLIKTVPLYEHLLRQSLDPSEVGGIETRSLERQFSTLIYNPLAQLYHYGGGKTPMAIIIDALDECSRQSDIDRILELFASLKYLDPLRLCVLFSSRRTPPLLVAFGGIAETDARCRVLALHEQFLEATKKELGVVLGNGLGKIKKRRRIKQEPWPNAGQFAFVLQQATTPSPLFIYISTLLLHISNGNTVQRFNNWIRGCQENVSQLDQIYMPIITAIFKGEEGNEGTELLNDDERTELRHVLGTRVLLEMPLPAKALHSLLGMHEDSIQLWLGALHAVVHVPDNDRSPVELIHKSFADFLLSEEKKRTDSFRIDPSEIHGMLAERCMSRLDEGLRKNLCNVPLAIHADEVCKDTITASLPVDLQYACVYWAYHLAQSKRTLVEVMVNSLLKKHLLHWIEALSLLGKMPEGEAVIRQLLDLMPRPRGSPRIPGGSFTGFLRDAQIFMREHGRTIRRYPLQIYSACLILSPQQSMVRQHFAESPDVRIAGIQRIKGGPVPQCTGMRQLILSEPIFRVAISPDGHLAAVDAGTHMAVVDLDTCIIRQKLPTDDYMASKIIALSFSIDGKHIITSSGCGDVHLWDTTGCTKQPTLQCKFGTPDKCHYFTRAAISAEFSLVAIMEVDSLGLWNFATEDCHCALKDRLDSWDDYQNWENTPPKQIQGERTNDVLRRGSPASSLYRDCNRSSRGHFTMR